MTFSNWKLEPASEASAIGGSRHSRSEADERDEHPARCARLRAKYRYPDEFPRTGVRSLLIKNRRIARGELVVSGSRNGRQEGGGGQELDPVFLSRGSAAGGNLHRRDAAETFGEVAQIPDAAGLLDRGPY